jgi:hypothetical protein
MTRAGRPERSLNPADGALEAFACELRALRRLANDLSYRKLAERTHYSHTVLSDAARGERLPTLAVTLAYVTACGGDPDEWRARWYLCRERLTAANPATEQMGNSEPASTGSEDAASAAAAAAAPGPGARKHEKPATRIRVGKRQVIVGMCVFAVLTQAEAIAVWGVTNGHSSPVQVEDGTDPKISNCGRDATVLDSHVIQLPVPALIGSRSFPVGTILGTVSLRYSARCAGAWARFDPAPGVYGANPGVAAVLLDVSRPADGAESTWRLPHVDQAYGDLLLTGLGCVTARATVELTGQDITATAQTRCLPHL